jgi:transcriptional regulator CtsR
MTKLFRVTSKVNKFSYQKRVYDSVEICWFVIHRENSSVSYVELIKNYGKEVNNSQDMFENNIKELFTEQEANILKEYLHRKHKQKCEIKRAELLLEAYTLGYGDLVPDSGEGFYKLNDEDGYDLPFVAWGYYDTTDAEDVSWLAYGTEFIEKVLDKIGVSITDKEKLSEAIEELKEEGLFVERGIKMKSRVKRESFK